MSHSTRISFHGVKYFLITSLVIIGCFLAFYGNREQKGLLVVDTNITSQVYVNGKKVGDSPVEVEIPAKGSQIEISASPTYHYSTYITPEPNVKTIVRRYFDEHIPFSYGETVTYNETLFQRQSALFVTNPPGATVSIDDAVRTGLSPLEMQDLVEGTHQVTITREGYKTHSIEVVVRKGYALYLLVDLAPEVELSK